MWSVAEGSRGRRWREVVTVGEGIRSSLLLEIDRTRRFSHLEVSTAAGLLTLHPEGDGTLHGNSVTRAGVHHVMGLPWQPSGVVLLAGSAICRAAAAEAAGVEAHSEPGNGDRVPGATPDLLVLEISLGLELRLVTAAVDRTTWSEGHGEPKLDGAASWSLELGEGAESHS